MACVSQRSWKSCVVAIFLCIALCSAWSPGLSAEVLNEQDLRELGYDGPEDLGFLEEVIASQIEEDLRAVSLEVLSEGAGGVGGAARTDEEAATAIEEIKVDPQLLPSANGRSIGVQILKIDVVLAPFLTAGEGQFLLHTLGQYLSSRGYELAPTLKSSASFGDAAVTPSMIPKAILNLSESHILGAPEEEAIRSNRSKLLFFLTSLCMLGFCITAAVLFSFARLRKSEAPNESIGEAEVPLSKAQVNENFLKVLSEDENDQLLQLPLEELVEKVKGMEIRAGEEFLNKLPVHPAIRARLAAALYKNKAT